MRYSFSIPIGILLLASPFTSASLSAQNLIPDGGFEDIKREPEKRGDAATLLRQWKSANQGNPDDPNASPDLYTMGGSAEERVRMPKTHYATVQPHGGDAIVGLVCLNKSIEFFEYLTTELTQPLTVGKTYKFTFWATYGEKIDYGNLAVNGLGCYLSMSQPSQQTSKNLGVKAQATLREPFYSDDWQELSVTFTADKAYRHLTFGAFESNDNVTTRTITNVPTSFAGAYIFFDDVSLQEVLPSGEAPAAKPLSSADRLNAMRTQLGGADYEAEQKRKQQEAENLRIAEENRRKAEEQTRIAQQARIAEENRRKAEEQTRIAQQARIAEENRRREEEQTRIAEAKRQEEIRQNEVRRKLQEAQIAEAKRIEELQRQQQQSDPTFRLSKIEKTKNAPNRIEDRRVEKQNSVEVSSRTLVLQVYDARAEDRDTVSLNWNGEWIMRRQMVKNKPVEITITLDPDGNNTLIFFAHNLGFIPPNTAVVSYMDGGKKKIIEVESDLKRCGAVEFKIK